MEHCGWLVEIIKRSDDAEGFVVLPRRWVVERTFGWLYRFRRLSKDYKVLPETSEAWIYAAMVRIMLQRLARNPAPYLDLTIGQPDFERDVTDRAIMGHAVSPSVGHL
jgi:hypothetical protein